MIEKEKRKDHSLEDLAAMEQELRARFYQGDQKDLSWISELIDTRLQRLAAKLIAYQLRQQLSKDDRKLTYVCGVPTKGTYLSVTLAEELNVPLIAAHKGSAVPRRWKKAVSVNNHLKPFKQGGNETHVYAKASSGDVILFTDDIFAEGKVIIPTFERMKEIGVTPYLGVYAAMLFESGYQALLERGVKPLYVYGFESIKPDGTLVLGPSILTGN